MNVINGRLPPDFYINAVKKAILATYCNTYYGSLTPDQFVDTLNRIFILKQKVFANIAAYVEYEVTVRGKPLEKTLENISFFASILFDRVERAGNQPIVK